MFYKCITVPKGEAASKRLDYNAATPDELLEERLSIPVFYALMRSGLFGFINKLTDANIDEYEDDSISGEKTLLLVIEELSKKKDHFAIPDDPTVIDRIILLFEEALKHKMEVHFFF